MFEKEINNGIQWLNQNYPDWFTKDFSDLDMSNGGCCMIPIVDGRNYDQFMDFYDYGDEWAVAHGFYFGLDLEHEGYNQLTDEWLDAISKLKTQAE